MNDHLAELADLLGMDEQSVASLLLDPLQRRGHGHGFEELPEGLGPWFASGEPVMVLVAVSPNLVTVAEPKVTWQGQRPVVGVLTMVAWDRVSLTSDNMLAWMTSQIEATARLVMRGFASAPSAVT